MQATAKHVVRISLGYMIYHEGELDIDNKLNSFFF